MQNRPSAKPEKPETTKARFTLIQTWGYPQCLPENQKAAYRVELITQLRLRGYQVQESGTLSTPSPRR